MRWERGRRSSNVEDRRGMRMSRTAKGGGLGVIVLALAALYFGVDPGIILNMGGVPQGDVVPGQSGQTRSPESDRMADFTSVVLADTEDTWNELFRQMNRTYTEPVLVLYTDAVDSACGFAQAASGPFYCPADHKLYIDLGFFRQLEQSYQAPGDFAQAYVIAHEVGHHVQSLLGISSKVQSLRSRLGKAEGNKLSVMLELQADCFAGVWANHADRTRHILEKGDIGEALAAASGVGDDRLQKQARGYVVPESFTHGSSKQRMYWFGRGIKHGDIEYCNTFEEVGF